MEWISVAIFLMGVGFGMVILRALYWFLGDPSCAVVRMTPEEFKDYLRSLDDEEGVTVTEMFDDLEDDEEDGF